MCIRRALICKLAPLGYARESPLRRDLLPAFNADDLSHGTGSNGWEGSARKTPSFVSVAASELEETLTQADGTGRGYNYVSVLLDVLAVYRGILDAIKPALPPSLATAIQAPSFVFFFPFPLLCNCLKNGMQAILQCMSNKWGQSMIFL